MSDVVSIHPYFRVHPGKLDQFKALLPKLIERVTKEEGCLGYDFTVSGDLVFCREAYRGAAGLLAHAANVEDLIGEALGMADLERVELHGPAAELEQLREPFAAMNPEYFEFVCGLKQS